MKNNNFNTQNVRSFNTNNNNNNGDENTKTKLMVFNLHLMSSKLKKHLLVPLLALKELTMKS